MGNKNDVHVQVLETVPILGFGIAYMHKQEGNRMQMVRACIINALCTFSIGGITFMTALWYPGYVFSNYMAV